MPSACTPVATSIGGVQAPFRWRETQMPTSGAPSRVPPNHALTRPAGAIYSVDPTLRREFQALPLRAVSDRPTTLTWLVDGAPIGTASSERALSWPLAVGAHEIEARDTEGRRARSSVVVK